MPFEKYLLLLFLLCCGILHAQENSQNDFYTAHFTDENGLPQNSVKSIVKDENGFVWLATEDGLVRFDGQKFYVFNKKYLHTESNRFPGFVSALKSGDQDANDFRAMTATGDYVKTLKNGLAALDKHFYPADFRSYPFVREFKERFDFLTDFHPKLIVGLFHNPFMIPVKNGKYYVWTMDEVRHYDKAKLLSACKGKYESFFLIGTNPFAITFAKNFLKINGSESKTVQLTGAIERDKDYLKNPRNIRLYWNNVAHQIFLAINDKLYALTENIKTGALETRLILSGFDLTYNEIISIYYDNALNSVFLGSSTKGLFLFRRNQFRNIASKEPGADNVYYSQIPLGGKSILAAQGYMITRDPDVKFRHVHFQKSIKDKIDSKYFIAAGQDSTFWVRISETLYKYDKKAERILAEYSLKDKIKALFVDYKGILWIGTEKDNLYQLNTLDPKSFPALIYTGNFGEIACMRRFSDDYLLLGTKKGLYQFAIKSKSMVLIKGLEFADVRNLYKNREGIWISTYGDGIFLLANGQLTRFPLDRDNYLATSHCIVEDKRGFFWITTNKGLFQVLKSDLMDFANKKQNSVYYLHYDKRNGFGTNEFNGGCQPCAIQLADGTVSLPSMNGLVWFKPEEFKTELPDKAIFISEITLDETAIETHNLTSIPRNFKQLHIGVVSPYFGSINNLQFRYSFDGEEGGPNWLLVPDNFSIQIPNTKSGWHTLTIRKQNGFGVNNFSEKKINVYITPAWYETWVFKLLLGILVLVIFWLILKFRTSYLLNEEKKKNIYRHYHISNQIVAAINHDIQTPLHYIGNSIQQIQNYLVRHNIGDSFISKLSQETVDTANRARVHTNNLLNYIKSQNRNGQQHLKMDVVDVYELVSNSCQLLSGIASYREVTLINHVPRNFVVFSNSKLLSVIIHNLLDNAVKLSESSITITSEFVGQHVTVIIRDTASGVPPDISQWLKRKYDSYDAWMQDYENMDHKGLGLIMVKDLSLLLNIDLALTVTEGEGSSFQLIFPYS